MTNGLDLDKATLPRPLDEVAMILATSLLRLRVKNRKERVSRDNSLGCPGETRPPAVDL